MNSRGISLNYRFRKSKMRNSLRRLIKINSSIPEEARPFFIGERKRTIFIPQSHYTHLKINKNVRFTLLFLEMSEFMTHRGDLVIHIVPLHFKK